MSLIKILKIALINIKFKNHNLFINKKNFTYKNKHMILVYIEKIYESLYTIFDLNECNGYQINDLNKYDYVKNKNYYIYILDTGNNSFGIYLLYNFKKDELKTIDF